MCDEGSKIAHNINICQGIHLLAVDVDGYPAGTALCHILAVWAKWPKCPAQSGNSIMDLKIGCYSLWGKRFEDLKSKNISSNFESGLTTLNLLF